MARPEHLKPFMQTRFTAAKRALRLAEGIGISIGFVGLILVFLPVRYEILAWCGGVLSVVLLVVQQHRMSRFREAYADAERVRRLFLLSDGLGDEVSEEEMARLRLSLGQFEHDGEEYYTSDFKPGPRRLLMLTWESAFWSEDLQGRLSERTWWHAALTTLGVVVVAVVALTVSQELLVPKLVVAAFSLVVGVNLLGRWWDSRLVAEACKATCRECRSMLTRQATTGGGQSELRQAMQIVLDYSATMLTAYPPPDKVYEQRKTELDEEWTRIAAEISQGQS